MNAEVIRRQGTVVMAGMPKTGKSTFLGALYHVLESGGNRTFELDRLPRARQHLEGLRGRWLRVEPEGRTSSASPVFNELTLRGRESGELLSLRWPDLSGEYFDDMVRLRTVNGEVAEILEQASAVVFFLHPDTIVQRPRIHEVNRVSDSVEEAVREAEGAQAEPKEEDKDPVDWNPMMVSGQVVVVELLQLLLDSQFGGSIDRMSIVVSAWDVVPGHISSPKAYVEGYLPLLNQFLETNGDRCRFALFGISALGGDPEEEKDKLQGVADPVQRVRAVSEEGAVCDDGILAPVRWLIE